MKINTVLGPIDSKDMGITLIHEHIINIEWNFAHAFPGFYDRESVVGMFCEEMAALKPLGVRTFVDATPITLGRDVQLMRECSERSGVNIIACTGLYGQEYPFFHWGVDPQVLADLMIREIEQGMEGTDSRPAFIKCATQTINGPSENNRSMLRAAAIAAKATGLPIYTHTDTGSELGLYQQQIFEEEGVDPRRIAYGHVFAAKKPGYLEELARNGSFVGCDQIAFCDRGGLTTAGLAKRLAELSGAGLRPQLLLSCDAALRSDFALTLSPLLRDREKNSLVLEGRREEMLFNRMLPALTENGFTQDMLRELLELNPRRFFGEQI